MSLIESVCVGVLITVVGGLLLEIIKKGKIKGLVITTFNFTMDSIRKLLDFIKGILS